MGSCRAGLIIGGVLALWAGMAHAACAPDVVELRTLSGTVQRFSVELADTPDARAQGLMFREHLASSAGMLFVFPAPKHAAFWMKNTLIPLDIIFADQTGRVTRVHEGAVPGDTTLIDGGAGVALVLEINAGLAKPLGIVEGVVLRHPAIAAEAASWSCSEP